MEKENQKKSDIDKYIRRIVLPIFDKVLKEAPKNQTSVGGPGKKKEDYCIYFPHNYRLYFDFDKGKFHKKKRITRSVRGRLGSVRYRLKNSKEHEFDSFFNCRITVKKNQIEVQNKIDAERKWKIPLSTTASREFHRIIGKKDNQCKEVLKKFIEVYGGKSNFCILNRYSENKIWHEAAIDLIPLKMKWHTKLSKKVYNEKNVEFPDPALASNYVETRAVESKSDVLQEEIRANREIIKGVLEVNASTSMVLNDFVAKFMPIQADFAINIRSHTAVIKNMVKATNKLTRAISSRQRKIGDFL